LIFLIFDIGICTLCKKYYFLFRIIVRSRYYRLYHFIFYILFSFSLYFHLQCLALHILFSAGLFLIERLYYFRNLKVISYCYHLVNVISFSPSQSYNINQITLWISTILFLLKKLNYFRSYLTVPNIFPANYKNTFFIFCFFCPRATIAWMHLSHRFAIFLWKIKIIFLFFLIFAVIVKSEWPDYLKLNVPFVRLFI
jgi:hypothetical protein